MTSLLTLSAHSIFEADLRQEVAAGEDGCPELLAGLLRTALGSDRAQPLLETLAAAGGRSGLLALEELSALTAGRGEAPAARAAVEEVLGWQTATDPQFIATLLAGPDLVRAAAVCWLRWSGRASLERALLDRLAFEGNPPWLVRTFARTLGIVGSENCFSVLQPLLRSDNPFTARVAVGAVVAIGSPLGVGLLSKLLHDRLSCVQTDVVRAIYLLDAVQGTQALASMASDPSPAVRLEALRLVDNLAPEGALELLLWRLRREDDEPVLDFLGEQLLACSPNLVMAAIAYGADQPDCAATRKCRILVERLRVRAGLTQEALQRAGLGYKPEPGPDFTWLPAPDRPAR